jgi:hypothetical protein
MIDTTFVETYGEDGVYASGFAFYPQLEQLVRLVLLECETRRRDGEPRQPTDPSTRLYWLLFQRWLRGYEADHARQRRVAEILGLEWPPPPPYGQRGWVWGHELRHGRDVPVVYPHDWDPETHPDVHGFAHRWTAGTTVVIGVDELPVDAELLDDEQDARRQRRPAPACARALSDAIDDAIVIPEPARRMPSLGPGRVIGTWAHDTGFSPWPDHPFGW